MIGYLFGRLSRAILNEVPNRTSGFTCWVVQLCSAYLFGSIMNDVVVYHLNGVFICVYENRYSDDWILFVTADLCECVVFWRIGLVVPICVNLWILEKITSTWNYEWEFDWLKNVTLTIEMTHGQLLFNWTITVPSNCCSWTCTLNSEVIM